MENFERRRSNLDCEKRCNTHEIERILMRNVGRVVTLFLEVGGLAGGGFTGLVTMVKDGTVKLTTSIPSAPFEKFRSNRREGDCSFELCGHCRNSHFGSAIVIPICKIIAVSVVEI